MFVKRVQMGFKVMPPWMIFVVFFFLLLPAVTLTANGRIIDDVAEEGRGRHWVSDIDQVVHRPKGGCILTIDDRTYETDDFPREEIFEERGKNLPFFIASRIINRAYARRHGYKFIVGQPETLEKIFTGRHPAWRKVLFIQQQLKCCCQWALFVDSDVYIRMDEHKLSIEHWLQLLDTPGYMSWIERKFKFNLEEAGQLHLPKKATSMLLPSHRSDGLILIAPRNGDPKHAYGKDVPLFPTPTTCDRECDFINSGVMLFRNSSLTHKLLDEWWSEPNDKLFNNHPWEQSRLSEVVLEYKSHVGVIPYLEATGPDGRQIRHLWVVKNPSYPERQLAQSLESQEQMHLAVLSVAALQEEDHLMRSQRRKRGE